MYPIGTRVRLKADMAVFQLGNYRAGETGTVTWRHEQWQGPPDEDVLAHVRMDEPHPELEEWSNQLHIYGCNGAGEVTWPAFEPVSHVRIVFEDTVAFTPFYSMAEGMWENHRDDPALSGGAAHQSLERIMMALDDATSFIEAFPPRLEVEIAWQDYPMAEDVLSSVLDNSSGWKREDDPEGELYAFADELRIEPFDPPPPPAAAAA